MIVKRFLFLKTRKVTKCWTSCSVNPNVRSLSLFKVNIMDWIANGSFKGDLEMLDKSGNGVGKIHVAVKFERPGQSRPPSIADTELCLKVDLSAEIAHRYDAPTVRG